MYHGRSDWLSLLCQILNSIIHKANIKASFLLQLPGKSAIIMTSVGVMDCSVCIQSFNQNDRQPKILPCGHTFCSTCLLSLTQRHQGLVPCPLCKRQHRIKDVPQLTTNFSILNLESVSQDIGASEKGPAVSAGYCEDHGEHKLFLCKSCNVWICHVCTVTEHPTSKCDVVSIKKALVEKKEEMRVQLQQSIETSEKMLDHLKNDGSELQHWYDQFVLQQQQIQAKCTELATKVDDACRDLIAAKDQGLTVIKTFRELQEELKSAEKLQDVDVCAQKIGQLRECAQEWMERARENASWKSGVLRMRNMKQLQMISKFTLGLSQAVDLLSDDQIEILISKTAESFSVSVYVEVQVDGRPLFAQVSTQSTTSAVLGDLDSNRPPPEAWITQLTDLLAKFSLVYVEVDTTEMQVHLPLVKDSKGCFWLEDQQDASPPSHRRHLLVPMTALLRSEKVWFKHWFAQRYSNLLYMSRDITNTGVITSLRSFQAQHPPEGSFMMTADVVAMLRPVIIVNLKLEWNGTTKNLFMELFGGAKRNVQFQLLCSGDKGHSYRLLSVVNRGRPGEMITCCDHDGTGGKPHLPDLPPQEITSRPVTAGLVAGKPNSSQFVIYTRDLPGATDPFGFGEVYSGLDILEEALKVEDIRDLTLSECRCFWKFRL